MKRKRALKMLMGAGMSRNAASRFIREPFAVENDAKVFVGLYRMAVRKSHVHIMADSDKTFKRSFVSFRRTSSHVATSTRTSNAPQTAFARFAEMMFSMFKAWSEEV